MTKKRNTSELSRSDLLAIAEALDRLSEQIKDAAETMKDGRPVHVTGFATCERGIGYVANWLGALKTAVATAPLAGIGSSEAEKLAKFLADKSEEIAKNEKAEKKSKTK